MSLGRDPRCHRGPWGIPTRSTERLLFCEGFRMPARARRIGRGGGPAFESLQGRKPRDEGAPTTLPRPMEIGRAARLAGDGLRRIVAGGRCIERLLGAEFGGESTTPGLCGRDEEPRS